MDKGCYNVICAFGTNTLFKNYKEKLAHFQILGVNKFIILFDGDKAGRDAGEKLDSILNENGFNADCIQLKDGQDPGSMTESEIEELMKGLYEK
jgi:DNA primase